MKVISNGKMLEVIGPRGPAGPDGNPIGSIISYMGTTAPKDYLICDGAVYNISSYPDLSDFFKDQFGSINYFGGDGTTTFAVPDMRNLFLRGYHGDSEDKFSGDIGYKQDATKHLNNLSGGSASAHYSFSPYITQYPPSGVENSDSITADAALIYEAAQGISDHTAGSFYTSRPVNMAVPYCIKAVESVSAENIYSIEEQRIGTWIDGKPFYRKTLVGTVPDHANNNIFLTTENDKEVYNLYGVSVSDTFTVPINSSDTSSRTIQVYYKNGDIFVSCGTPFYGSTVYVTIEYTKTTDQATIGLPAALTAEPAQVTYETVSQSAAAVTLDAGIKTEESCKQKSSPKMKKI